MKNYKLKLVAAAIMLSLGAIGSVSAADDTSSAMRGKITGPEGNAAINVRVTVKHMPSGTIKEFMTNSTGTFIAKGLRVGGPYEITLDSDLFSDATVNNIFLQLGDTYRLVRQLDAQYIERIAVTGQRFVEATGSTSTFGQDLIDNMPSLNRDLKDIARLNPLATLSGNGNLSFAGANPRSNSITVDGIGQNDDFGLNYGGYPTSQPPISLDAIAQISVSAAPFSARKGGFDGGNINAVTKSGTNEFHGTAFYEYTDPDLAGKTDSMSQVFDDNRDPILDDEFHRTYSTNSSESTNSNSTFGLSFGGAIIKDELFFFVNYSNWSDEIEFDPGFEGSGAGNEYDISQAEFDEFNQILSEVYNLEDSLYGSPKDKDEKILVKLDWNINDAHRLAFTYQTQDNVDIKNTSAGGSTVKLSSAVYNKHSETSNIALKFYSDWSESFNTEFGVSYKDVKSVSETNANFGSVEVHTKDRGPSIIFGNDGFHQNNAAHNKNLKVHLDANYLIGEHSINFGFEIERLNLYNLFAKNSQGVWEFNTFEDFRKQDLGGGSFAYGNAYTNNADDTAYDNVRYTSVFYVEDSFYLTDNIELTAGLRYERISTDDKPTLNANFLETYGISNQENLDGLDIFMPRVEVKWYASDDLTLRGGIGRFSGGIPNVWYNGPFTADGLTFVDAQSSFTKAYYATEGNLVDINQVPQAIQESLQPGAGSTSYIDPNFKLPSDWRVQIAVDYTFDIPVLGDNFAWTTELTYKKKKDEQVWKDSSRNPLDENGSINYAADDERIIMASNYQGTGLEDNYDIELTNAEKNGRSIIFTTSLSKYWNSGFSLTTSYAHQDVTENTGGTNSRNSSNYNNTVTVNRNQETVGRGYYEVEHSFKLNLGYQAELFEGYNTNINLYYERHSGRPLSWISGFFEDEALGDQEDFDRFSPYLPYVPSGADDPNVDWTGSNAVSWDELSKILERAGIDACGCIIARGAATQPWVTELDLSIKQEIPGFIDGHKGQLYFTIDNLANLLNSDWGQEKTARYPKNIYDFGGLSEDGKYQLERSYDGYDVRNYSGIETSSTWHVKLGVRYSF
jgi:hypothetical protein